MTYLPRDNDNETIPALRLRPQSAHVIDANNATSAQNTVSFNEDTRVISLYATEPVYIEFGDNTVVASSSSHYFPSGIYYDLAIGGDKTMHTPYIAVMAVSNNAQLYISEKV